MGSKVKACYVKQWDFRGSSFLEKPTVPNCLVISRQYGIALMLLAMSPTPRPFAGGFMCSKKLKAEDLKLHEWEVDGACWSWPQILRISINGGYPIIHFIGIFYSKATILGYPHGHGNHREQV